MCKPKRIQRKRIKGWRMPENCVSVCRPGVFGNPFKVEPGAHYRSTPAQAVGSFEDWLQGRAFVEDYQEKRQQLLKRLPELRGKDLACFCPLDAPCHADLLLKLANESEVSC